MQEVQEAQEASKIYSIDTNIILDDPAHLISLSENNKNIIIIPEVVIDELDAKKSGFEDINYNARQFGRLLEDAEITSKKDYNNLSIIETTIESLGITLNIISQKKYDCEETNIATNILNDRKILEATQSYIEYTKSNGLIFLSLDIMCRTRALTLGILTETLKGKDQVKEYQFHKELKVENINAQFNGKNILELDTNYEPMNYSYTLVDENGQQKIGQVHNGHFYIIPEKAPHKRYIQPMNKEQKFFVNAIEEGYANILVIDAKAGSGKSLLSIATAMNLVRKKEFNKIVYIRNSIESLDKGEDIGYLPGLEEKFAIYNHPLMDSLKNIASTEIKNSNKNKSKAVSTSEDDEAVNTKVAKYMTEFGIETMWPGEMRGRTISGSVVIVDEAQNMSGKTLQLILSRVDATCKVIVIGSNKQIDNLYTNKYINGMSTLIKNCDEVHEEVNLWAGELNKVLRGPITEFAEKIFSK